MAANEGALRRKVEETHATVADLRTKWAEERDDGIGRQLVEARAHASAALEALWDAVPDEKPPTQRVM